MFDVPSITDGACGPLETLLAVLLAESLGGDAAIEDVKLNGLPKVSVAVVLGVAYADMGPVEVEFRTSEVTGPLLVAAEATVAVPVAPVEAGVLASLFTAELPLLSILPIPFFTFDPSEALRFTNEPCLEGGGENWPITVCPGVC